MKTMAAAVGDALRSGRFLTVWSLGISFLLSFTVMAPSGDPAADAGRLAATAECWVCFAVGLVILGALERVTQSPGARVAVVVLGLTALSATRPLVQDGWLGASGDPVGPPWELPFRILTNLVVWFVALSACAVLVNTTRSLRTTNGTLRALVIELDAAHERAALFDLRSRAAVDDAVTRLRREVSLCRAQPTAAVRAARELGAKMRSFSHSLGEDASSELAAVESPRGDDALTVSSPRGRRARHSLRVPPAGVVAVLYIACLVPYAAHAASLPGIVSAFVIVVVGGMVVDRVSRRCLRSRRPSSAAFAFLTGSALVGIALSTIVAVSGLRSALVFVPAVAYVALAWGTAACAGRVHALRVEQRRLSDTVAAEQRASRSETARTRLAVGAVAELLHRDGQGTCTVFAMQHTDPQQDDVAELVDRLDEILDQVANVFDQKRPSVDASTIDELIATWARVLPVETEVSQASRAALDAHPACARTAYEVIAEGLLNGAKYGAGGRARIACAVVATGAGPRLRVRVLTPGRLVSGTQLHPSSHVGHLGARLHAEADGVVLQALIAFDAEDSGPVVMSAEHPRRGTIAGP